ncbi:MAG TPA: hypothetical protein VMW10_10170 [Alphaproteobacteria bacterium]|nr:hypothetical protein [Alphaproteobacteria bacterium]
MYILNPSAENLSSWFECKKSVAKYLLSKGLNFIHRNKQYFYFVRTDEMEGALKGLPFLVKIFKDW